MDRLFIIGNGFDLAHGIPSAYKNFRDYLIDESELLKTLPDEDLDFYKKNGFDSYEDVIETLIFDDNKVIKIDNSELTIPLILYFFDYCDNPKGDTLWADLEKNMGDIRSFNEIVDTEADDFAEMGLLGFTKTLPDIFSKRIIMVYEYFKDWIIGAVNPKILEKSPINKFKKLVEKQNKDYFLSFNYTDTLTNKYFINDNDICYIHGNATKDKKLIVGHHNPNAFDFRFLYKNTDKIIKNHINFFNGLKNVKEVYSYGFSFSSVDRDYVKKVIQSIDNSADSIWYIEQYPGHDKINRFKTIILDNGFKGTIKTF